MSYLLIIFIIGLLILIHEAGHFFAARAAGIPVEAFSIGFGPVLWKKRIGPTEYRFSLIPVGGYVLPAAANEQEFYAIPVNRRILFSLGGPAANILLSLLLMALLNGINGGFSPAGLLIEPFRQTGLLLYKITASLATLFSKPENISGIVGITRDGSRFIGTDILRAIQFAAIISANLAVFNMLPLPVLDGGKIILCLLEKINRRMTAYYMPIVIGGWVLIIGLMIYATVLDIARLS